MSKLTSNHIFAFVFINAQSCIEKNLVETEQTCLLLKFKFFAVKFLRKKSLHQKSLLQFTSLPLSWEDAPVWQHCVADVTVSCPLPHALMLCHHRTAISFACADETVGVPFLSTFFVFPFFF